MTKAEVRKGMNLIDAEKLARKLDAEVRPRRRTGEIEFRHPALQRRVVVNGRRKDSSRAVTGWLKDLARVLGSRVQE